MDHFDFSMLSQNRQIQVKYAIVFYMIWAFLYLSVDFLVDSMLFHSNKSKNIRYSKLFKRSKTDLEILDIKNRIIATVHGLTSFWLGSIAFFATFQFDRPNTNFQTFVLIWSTTYFSYHLVVTAMNGLSHASLVIHHVTTCLGFLAVMHYRFGALDCMGGLAVGEISNIWMHGRNLTRLFDRKYTKLYDLFENVFFALYFIFRGIIFPIMIFHPSIMAVQTPILLKIVEVCLLAQSLYFMYQMVSIIKGKFKKYAEMKDKKVSYKWLQQDEQQLKKLTFYRGSEKTPVF